MTPWESAGGGRDGAAPRAGGQGGGDTRAGGQGGGDTRAGGQDGGVPHHGSGLPVRHAGGRTPPVLDVRRVTKVYGEGDTGVQALRGVTLAVERGDFVAIMGASGSGKSTLMNILGCLDVPSAGAYLIDGTDVGALDDRQLAILRNRKIGFVFQSFNLIPRMTALANVELPLAYGGVGAGARRRRALAALDQVGLSDRVQHEPNELSGGQQQRVAVARALVTAPSLLLADEPTGNLDTKSTADVLAILDRLSDAGRTIVLITHEDDVATHAKRVVRLVDGQVVEDRRQAPVDGPPPRLSSQVVRDR